MTCVRAKKAGLMARPFFFSCFRRDQDFFLAAFFAGSFFAVGFFSGSTRVIW
jgi:hypothetical protein